MDVIELLEKLANRSHQQSLNDLLHSQPAPIRDAFLNSNNILLKKQFGEIESLANRCLVTHINVE